MAPDWVLDDLLAAVATRLQPRAEVDHAQVSWTWERILALVATTAGWSYERFIEEFGVDGYALERFLNYEKAKDQTADDDDDEEPEVER